MIAHGLVLDFQKAVRRSASSRATALSPPMASSLSAARVCRISCCCMASSSWRSLCSTFGLLDREAVEIDRVQDRCAPARTSRPRVRPLSAPRARRPLCADHRAPAAVHRAPRPPPEWRRQRRPAPRSCGAHAPTISLSRLARRSCRRFRSAPRLAFASRIRSARSRRSASRMANCSGSSPSPVRPLRLQRR